MEGQKKNQSESFELSHKMNRRLASIDKYYMMSVSTKAFNEYFGSHTFGSILEAVLPEDKARLAAFIESFDGTPKSDFFRFYNSELEGKLNHFFMFPQKGTNNSGFVDVEMVDVETIEAVNNGLRDDVSKHKILLGLAKEYTFSYNREDNIFSMYRYDVESREIIYKEDLDDWKKKMLSEGFIPESDRDNFANLISEIRGYVQTFSVKLNTSMRTNKKVMENLRFIGTVMKKNTGNDIVIGRVIPEENMHNYNQVADMLEELQYDSLTHVYNKKTITEYAKKLLKEETHNRITIAVLDLDHFKKVNDIYGHMYGDKVLARAAKKIKDVVGEDGVVGRIGGDEFIVILNGVNDENTLRGILRAIRTQIKWEFFNDFEDIMITTSIGASICPNNGNDYEELFKKADYCLYVAKEKGRDRYVFFRDDLHLDSYLNSTTNKEKSANDGREMVELRHLAEVMESFGKDGEKCIKDMFTHMYHTFKLDSISVYWGKELKKIHFVGKELEESETADYVKTMGFKKLLDGKKHAEIGFVGRQADVAPEFVKAMERRGVNSTIHCIIGDEDNIKGVLTLDRCKASAQWANYEIESAVITASLMGIMAK